MTFIPVSLFTAHAQNQRAARAAQITAASVDGALLVTIVALAILVLLHASTPLTQLNFLINTLSSITFFKYGGLFLVAAGLLITDAIAGVVLSCRVLKRRKKEIETNERLLPPVPPNTAEEGSGKDIAQKAQEDEEKKGAGGGGSSIRDSTHNPEKSEDTKIPETKTNNYLDYEEIPSLNEHLTIETETNVYFDLNAALQEEKLEEDTPPPLPSRYPPLPARPTARPYSETQPNPGFTLPEPPLRSSEAVNGASSRTDEEKLLSEPLTGSSETESSGADFSLGATVTPHSFEILHAIEIPKHTKSSASKESSMVLALKEINNKFISEDKPIPLIGDEQLSKMAQIISAPEAVNEQIIGRRKAIKKTKAVVNSESLARVLQTVTQVYLPLKLGHTIEDCSNSKAKEEAKRSIKNSITSSLEKKPLSEQTADWGNPANTLVMAVSNLSEMDNAALDFLQDYLEKLSLYINNSKDMDDKEKRIKFCNRYCESIEKETGLIAALNKKMQEAGGGAKATSQALKDVNDEKIKTTLEGEQKKIQKSLTCELSNKNFAKGTLKFDIPLDSIAQETRKISPGTWASFRSAYALSVTDLVVPLSSTQNTQWSHEEINLFKEISGKIDSSTSIEIFISLLKIIQESSKYLNEALGDDDVVKHIAELTSNKPKLLQEYQQRMKTLELTYKILNKALSAVTMPGFFRALIKALNEAEKTIKD